MFSKELRDMLLQVITSWQVLAVTVAVILYFFLVSYVGRSYRRPRHASAKLIPKARHAGEAAVVAEDEVEEEQSSEDEDLGLEEE
jgi:flagellar biosynthesis/type III secretory pathway M-ring protein FliF/YscJ